MICDLAETYHLFDYQKYSALYVATLVQGLGINSRVHSKIININSSFNTLLLAHCVDALRLLIWSKSKDAETDSNRPISIAEGLIQSIKKDDKKIYASFASEEEFEKERKRIVEGSDC